MFEGARVWIHFGRRVWKDRCTGQNHRLTLALTTSTGGGLYAGLPGGISRAMFTFSSVLSLFISPSCAEAPLWGPWSLVSMATAETFTCAWAQGSTGP